MNNGIFEEFLYHVSDPLDEFRNARSVTEVRDQFLSLYVLQFLSSRVSPLKVPHEVTVEFLLAAGETGIYGRLNEATKKLERENLGLEGVFANFDRPLNSGNLKFFSEKPLYRLLKKLNSFAWDKYPDAYPSVFNELIAHFAENSKRTEPNFHSPSAVVNLVAALLNPGPGMSLYDPVCGSGSLLVAAASRADANGQGHIPRTLAGQDMSLDAWRITKQNLLIHQFFDADIQVGNVLEKPANAGVDGFLKKFDIAVANPPFSLSWNRHEYEAHGYNRFKYGAPPSQNADYAFIQHILESLNDKGRAAVIVPDGVLFRGATEQKIREGIVRDHHVAAVISLPPNLFYGTSIPTNILILRKKIAGDTILFIDGRQNLHVKNKRHKTIEQNELDEIVDIFKEAQEVEGLSRKVSLKEVEENDFNLTVSRYISTVSVKEMTPVDQLIQKQVELEASLTSLQIEMKKLLKSAQKNV